MSDYFEEYNEKMKKQKEAEEWLMKKVQDAMILFELDNTETSSVLASLLNKWTHYSFHSAYMYKKEKDS